VIKKNDMIDSDDDYDPEEALDVINEKKSSKMSSMHYYVILPKKT